MEAKWQSRDQFVEEMGTTGGMEKTSENSWKKALVVCSYRFVKRWGGGNACTSPANSKMSCSFKQCPYVDISDHSLSEGRLS